MAVAGAPLVANRLQVCHMIWDGDALCAHPTLPHVRRPGTHLVKARLLQRLKAPPRDAAGVRCIPAPLPLKVGAQQQTQGTQRLPSSAPHSPVLVLQAAQDARGAGAGLAYEARQHRQEGGGTLLCRHVCSNQPP